MVIPAMDTIDETLGTNALSSKYSVAIQAALSIGKKTLNRYYAKTDFSNTYRIAMGMHYSFVFHNCLIIVPVLHPRHKLNYFKNEKWEDDWIEAAKRLVRDEFDLSYNCPPAPQGPMPSNKVCTTRSEYIPHSHLIHFIIGRCMLFKKQQHLR
jgi:hypothetical protein